MALDIKIKTNTKALSKNVGKFQSRLTRAIDKGVKQAGFQLVDIIRTKTSKGIDARDLPFAQKRFCGAEGIDNVIMASDFKNGDFGRDLGVIFIDGPLSSLLSRSVIVTNENGEVIFTEQVNETVNEPDYKSAIEALS